MKFKTALFLLFLISIHSYGRSIVPDKVVTPSLNIFSNKVLPTGEVEVKVTTYSRGGEFQKNRAKQILSPAQFKAFEKLAMPVFQMIPKQSNRSEEDSRRGTAFGIGENLVITNHHILDPNFQNKTQCSDFQVKNNTGDTFPCKKVHYCNPEHDICLIEMKPITKTQRDCFLCSGTKYEVSLAQGPNLKLKAHYYPESSKRDSEILTAIGNSSGFGIHLSQGRGMFFKNDRLYFYAPITTGNSGGALLNSEGLVVGVVKAQSKVLINTDPLKAFNVSATTDIVIRLIRDGLRHDQETLEKFNRSVVE